MIVLNPYDTTWPQQLRFKDFEGDTVWFDTCAKDGTVIVTMPYEDHDGLGTSYRQIELSDTDRVALIAHLQT